MSWSRPTVGRCRSQRRTTTWCCGAAAAVWSARSSGRPASRPRKSPTVPRAAGRCGCAAPCPRRTGAPRAKPRTGGSTSPATTLGGGRVRMLSIDPRVFDRAYNAIANRVLWFVAHMLFDTSVAPRFDAGFRKQWDSYERYCRAFALAIAEDAAEGAVVLVQDYHLTLTPGLLRQRRPDLRIGFFCHTPWAPPEYFRMLPGTVARDVLAGILGRGPRRIPQPPMGSRVRGVLRRRSWTRTSAATSSGTRGATPSWACILSASTARSCAGGPPAATSFPGLRRCATSWAGGRRSCGSTGWSCRRTSSAAWRPTGSCCAPAPNGATGSRTSRWPTRRAATCAEYREYTGSVLRIGRGDPQRVQHRVLGAARARRQRRLRTLAGRLQQSPMSCWSTPSGTG